MEHSNLGGRILSDIENIIRTTCSKKSVSSSDQNLHRAILKKYYNASDISIDYQRKRIKMEIIMDDTAYNPKTINSYLPTLHTNLWFRNLSDFLVSCIDNDPKSLAYYAGILRLNKRSKQLSTAV